ncbi:MAG: hypothetical protein ACXVKK_03260 [Flavisolibacter sp.]
MEQDNFQWSIMVNGREQQFVVRADNISDLADRIAEVEILIAQRKGVIPAKSEQETEQQTGHFCSIHLTEGKPTPLRERKNTKNGSIYHDHRWLTADGVWHRCDGEKTNPPETI